ncbi:hypothetical protein [Mucilaginibacter antarcticus]|uniref:ABC transporter permease n=1 Tax=Mucilaginibacter antarcticus TaxID=1855725 RepID=A0ABW5XNE9_9SPHI
MNNTFNLTRFLSYFKKHTIDNGKTYLLSTAVLVGILALALLFVVATGTGHLSTDWQMTVLMFCVLFGGSVFASLTFADLSDKRKAIPALTLPVSNLEKFLVSWIYTYVIFLLVSFGAFYLVDVVAVCFSKPSTYFGETKLLDLTNQATPGTLVLGVFTLFHAFAFWGAIFFTKLHFIKASFVFFICLIVLTLLNKGLLFSLSDNHISQHMLMSGVQISENGRTTYYVPDTLVINLMPVVFIICVFILWASAYFRLKEKQV